MFAHPAPEPLLSFSSPAQPPKDPFDLLGMDDVHVIQPAQIKAPVGGNLSQLKHEVVETISKTLAGQILFHFNVLVFLCCLLTNCSLSFFSQALRSKVRAQVISWDLSLLLSNCATLATTAMALWTT